MECNAAPTVCACLFGRDCTLKVEGTILAAAETYNMAVAQVRGAKPESWAGVPQHVSTDKEDEKHTCVCGKSLASVHVLKNNAAEGWLPARAKACK